MFFARPRLFKLDGGWRCWSIAADPSYLPQIAGRGATPGEAYKDWLDDVLRQISSSQCPARVTQSRAGNYNIN